MAYEVLYIPPDKSQDQAQTPQAQAPQQQVEHPMQQMSEQAMAMQQPVAQPQATQQQRKLTALEKFQAGTPDEDVNNSDEGYLHQAGRVALGAGARLIEGAVSEPGDIANMVGDITSLAGSPTYQDLQNESPISLPTSSQSREFVDKATNNLLKPRGGIEETIQNIAKDIGGYLPWLFLGPVGGALGGLKKAVKVATGSNLLAQGVKAVGGGPLAQSIAKIGGGLAIGLRGTRKAAQELHDVSYNKAAANLPQNATIDATQLENNVERIAEEATKYNIHSAKDVRTEAKAIKDLIQEHPNLNTENLGRVRKSLGTKFSNNKIPLDSQELTNELMEDINKLTSNNKLTASEAKAFNTKWKGKLKEGDIPFAIKDELNAVFNSVKTKKVIPVWDAWGFKKSLTEKMFKSDTVKGDARKYYGNLVGTLKEDALNAYGKVNKGFGKNFGIGEDLHKGLTEASKITQFFTKHTSLENFMKKQPVLKALLGVSAYHGGFTAPALGALAAGAATGISVRELSKFKDLLTNSKEAGRLWRNILKGAAQNNLALVTSSLERLDNMSSEFNQ